MGCMSERRDTAQILLAPQRRGLCLCHYRRGAGVKLAYDLVAQPANA